MKKQTPYCPTCGRPNEIRHSPEWLLSEFKGLYASVLSELIVSRRDKRPSTIRELCQAAYPKLKDDLPVEAKNTILVTMARNRNRLNRFGWDIIGPKTTGAGYRLVPTE